MSFELEIKVDIKHILYFYFLSGFIFGNRNSLEDIISLLPLFAFLPAPFSQELRMAFGFINFSPAKIPHKLTSSGTCVLVRVFIAARSVLFSLLK